MTADSKKSEATNTSAADGSDSAEPAQSSAGNFLRNDKSLVRRQSRSDRFTEKFREGIVQRILNGTMTIAEVRKQYFLTEEDVIAWMKSCFDRKQKRLDRMTEILRKTQSKDKDHIVKVDSQQPRRVDIKGDVIDGRSQSKQPQTKKPTP